MSGFYTDGRRYICQYQDYLKITMSLKIKLTKNQALQLPPPFPPSYPQHPTAYTNLSQLPPSPQSSSYYTPAPTPDALTYPTATSLIYTY